MQGIISNVRRNSLADAVGIKAGEKLFSINGNQVHDIIELSYFTVEEKIELIIESIDGEKRLITIEKHHDEDLGLEFESAVFDQVTTCQNNCVFCFVDQMLPGMRKSLYVRDDDYRLSFLYGNFITLTNLQESDFERIIQTHMSPLYVSIHTTNPDTRCLMMNNRFAGKIMENIQRLLDAGIKIHTQIVCCPEYNDGKILEDTYHKLVALAPGIETMAVVPVGITKCREHLTSLRLFNQQEASSIVEKVTAWQKDCRQKFGKSFIYLGDEFYLLADQPLPTAEWYDGFPQLENGIGLSRNFIDEWQLEISKNIAAKAQIESAVLPIGAAGYKIIFPLIEAFNNKYGTQHKLLAVENIFFGTTINVTGLLTGQDILQATKNYSRIILPSLVLNNDGLLLDDMTLQEFKKKFNGRVDCAATAAQLFSLLIQ